MNTLAGQDQSRSVTVEAVPGGRAFDITVGDARNSLVNRVFVYKENGIDTSRVVTGSRIPQVVAHAAMSSEGLGPVEDGISYVAPEGLTASQRDIVHEGGIHSTPQELNGGLLTERYPLGKIPHQPEYNGGACALLGIPC